MPNYGFAVLGPLTASADDAEIPLSSAVHRAVLAMLLLHANRPVSADALAEAIWDGDPPTTARAKRSWLSSWLAWLPAWAPPAENPCC